jgi:hypothetical protein
LEYLLVKKLTLERPQCLSGVKNGRYIDNANRAVRQKKSAKIIVRLFLTNPIHLL